MQTQDVSDDILLRFWPWVEANRNRLIAIGGVVLVVLFVWYYLNTRSQEKQLEAGQAYTEVLMNQPPTRPSQQLVDGCLQIAQQYSGTMAGQRAQLQAAIGLFDEGKYADAQKQFENFLSANSSSPLSASAQAGVAASLEAQSKLDQALTEYQAVTTTYPETAIATEAKYACGRVLELQGKLKDALASYQDVARSPLAGSLASISRQRIAELQTKLNALEAPKAGAQKVNNQKNTNPTK